MRGNIAIRVFIAAVIMGITYLGMYLVAWGIQVPEVILPDWNILDLPKQLDEWKGEDVKLDQRLFQATGAHSILERQYRDDSGMVISIHLALFANPTEGIWHNPMSCYVSAGWNLLSSTKEPISETDETSDKISVCTWEKSGEKALVGHWYQLGEHRLYSRIDLGAVRWEMKGRKTWPALIKILISTNAGIKPEDTQAKMINFANLVHRWLNQPQHQTKDQSADPEPAAPK